MIRLAASAVALSLLAGCAGKLTNRVYCSVDGSSELAFVSWYHRIGIAAKVDDQVDCSRLVSRPAAAASAAN